MRKFYLSFIVGFSCLLSVVSAAEVTAVSTLKRGQIIGPRDIEVSAYSAIEKETIRSEFVGMQASRTIYAGHKITTASIEMPVMVKRNRNVTMRYTYGSMEIITYGRALSEGAMGEMVQVMNMDSKQKVMAVVTGLDAVSVQ